VLAVLSLAQSFKFEVVAEGVESAEDLYRLQELGCTAMQGYFLGRPKSRHATIEWIGQSHPAKAADADGVDLAALPPLPGTIASKPTLQ
jgi:EAL domain-containing protein (putative c-di-GMP-specific phosphodiesterase class I)